MNYILVVDDEEDIRDIYEMILSRSFPLDVVMAKSGNGALKVIEERGRPEIVISDLRMADGDGTFLYQSLIERKINVPFVICSTDSREVLKKKFPEIHGYIEKPKIVGPLVELVNSVVEKHEEDPDYVPARISLLLRWGTAHFDLYMKLSGSKFIKVINADEAFIPSDAKRFNAKSLHFLYIRKEDADLYLRRLESNITILEKTNEVFEDLSIFSLESLESIEKIGSALGWPSTVLQVAKHAVNLAIKAVLVEPNILKLLKQKLSDPTNVYSSHVGTIALISCGFCQQLGWTSESTQMKLGLAALLHDLTLDEKIYDDVGHWNNIASNSDDKSSETVKYRNHPIEASNLLLSMRNVPADVDQIILQHHEMKDGNGFPRGLISTRITPMASVFIIVEDLVNFLHDQENLELGVKEFLRIREEIYSSGNFKKVFEVLKMSEH